MKIVERVLLSERCKIFEKIRRKKPFIIQTDINLKDCFNNFLSASLQESIHILKFTGITNTRKNASIKKVTLADYLDDDFIKLGYRVCENILQSNFFREYELCFSHSNPNLFEIINLRKAKAINFWLTPANQFAGLHYDSMDNFNFQVSGKKTFYIAPPQVRGFYTGKISEQKSHTSEVNNIFDYDTKKFPKFSANISRFYRAELNKGDILYLPVFWWHQVHTGANELSENINWWYVNHKAALIHPKKILAFILVGIYKHRLQKHGSVLKEG